MSGKNVFLVGERKAWNEDEIMKIAGCKHHVS
jgi:hypothetical protein